MADDLFPLDMHDGPTCEEEEEEEVPAEDEQVSRLTKVDFISKISDKDMHAHATVVAQ